MPDHDDDRHKIPAAEMIRTAEFLFDVGQPLLAAELMECLWDRCNVRDDFELLRKVHSLYQAAGESAFGQAREAALVWSGALWEEAIARDAARGIHHDGAAPQETGCLEWDAQQAEDAERVLPFGRGLPIAPRRPYDLDDCPAGTGPTDAELRRIGAGWLVKVQVSGETFSPERFWVLVDRVGREPSGKVLHGNVNNHLLGTEAHGLEAGSPLRFLRRHVWQVQPPVAGEVPS